MKKYLKQYPVGTRLIALQGQFRGQMATIQKKSGNKVLVFDPISDGAGISITTASGEIRLSGFHIVGHRSPHRFIISMFILLGVAMTSVILWRLL